MIDKERIKKFAKSLGMKAVVWDRPEYICEAARKHGATQSVSLGYGESDENLEASHLADLNFELDSKGNCIGFSTSRISSFKKRLKESR